MPADKIPTRLQRWPPFQWIPGPPLRFSPSAPKKNLNRQVGWLFGLESGSVRYRQPLPECEDGLVQKTVPRGLEACARTRGTQDTLGGNRRAFQFLS